MFSETRGQKSLSFGMCNLSVSQSSGPFRVDGKIAKKKKKKGKIEKLSIERTLSVKINVLSHFLYWVDAQADLSLCWAHRSFCWFDHAAAQTTISCSAF